MRIRNVHIKQIFRNSGSVFKFSITISGMKGMKEGVVKTLNSGGTTFVFVDLNVMKL